MSGVNLAKISEEKIRKMTERVDRIDDIIYPEDTFKSRWDLFLTFVLLGTCIITPYRIAFGPA